jgi:hypothetical protein
MKATDLHPSALAFCPACCTTETPRFDYNTLLVDPVHTSCGCEYEFLKPTELHRRNLAEQAEAFVRAQAEVVKAMPEPAENGRRRRRIVLEELPLLLSQAQAARALGYDLKTTVHQMIESGALETRPGPKGPRVLRSSIERILNDDASALRDPATESRPAVKPRVKNRAKVNRQGHDGHDAEAAILALRLPEPKP